MRSSREAAASLLARLRLLASGSKGLSTCSSSTAASQARLAALCEAETAAGRQGLPTSLQRQGGRGRMQGSRWAQVGPGFHV